ncbi:hypothetical protein T06_5362 [Trichinella sp. T6]|nr:hypothetical protein T06_5362 [Trichinella sp. T6]
MGQFLTKKKYSAHEHPMLNRTSNGERNAFIIGSFEMQCDNMTLSLQAADSKSFPTLSKWPHRLTMIECDTEPFNQSSSEMVVGLFDAEIATNFDNASIQKQFLHNKRKQHTLLELA